MLAALPRLVESGSFVDPSASLDVLEKRKISCPAGIRTPYYSFHILVTILPMLSWHPHLTLNFMITVHLQVGCVPTVMWAFRGMDVKFHTML
jgi:hypothetical protein